ncbi:MAG TPA: hypothetical protein VNP89_10295 [Gaiellaceae bacterium]|nr:hypothetical protein [Gaiellaceae bacterium]
MNASDPGLDLHEWETRWSELELALADDPGGTLAEACDLIEEMLDVDAAGDDIAATYRAAREIADAVERGDDVDPGDLGAAVENLRFVRTAVAPGRTE